jgi:DNA-binding response OmpR family regulator
MSETSIRKAFIESLSGKEREIVDLLASAGGEVVPKVRVLSLLEGRAPRTLDTYLKQIRAKMRQAGLSADALKTHVGVGYALTLESII